MSRIILHIDLNTFFVRCEEIKNPLLEGKPVAVGGVGRGGIVSTCSYKAREYGIHSGMPMFQAQMLCKNLIVIPCDFHNYELYSREFIHYVRTYTSLVEQTSVDECFADFTNVYYQYGNNNIDEFLKEFQIGLFNKTKLKCSIGVAPTKFLAKMGSDMKKPNGITIIRKKDIPSKIFPLPIKAFFGIGKKTYPILEEIGIKTIGDLYYGIKSQRDDVNGIIGSFSTSIISELEGNSSFKINTANSDPKSIGTTSTFEENSDDSEFILPFMIQQTKSILKELHKAKKLTKTIQLTYKNAKFDEESCQFKVKQFSKTLMNPTNNDDTIIEAVRNLFKETYNGQLIRMSGVCFQNLTDAKDAKIQMTFDDFENDDSIDKTHDIIESLNREINKKMFFRASELKDEDLFKNGSK